MARIEGVAKGGSLLARVAFFLTRRKVGKVVKPVRVHALHPALLWPYGRMEMVQTKSFRVPPVVRSLAAVRAAMLIGCPF